jgi:threonyl-tRNA synthetase
VQAKILPVSDKYLDYAREVEAQLKQAGIRVEVDSRDGKLGQKIRDGRLSKVPYMLIVGEQEKASDAVSVRMRDADEDKQDLGVMDVSAFAAKVQSEE